MSNETLRRQLALVMRGSFVKRYHNRTTIVTDTVGRHSNVVAFLCYIIGGGQAVVGNVVDVKLLMAAAQHDWPEAVASDISAPVKKLIGERVDALEDQILQRVKMPNFWHALTDEQRAVLKLADVLEGLMFSLHEHRGLYNKVMYGVAETYRKYSVHLITIAPPGIQERAKEVFSAIFEIFDLNENEEDHCL